MVEQLRGLAFGQKAVTVRRAPLSGILIMRDGFIALTFVALLVQPSFAQGTKDKANLTSTSIVTTPTKKTQTAQSASRPTATRNLAPGKLPSGMAAQGVWRDGKLIAVPRQ
ncbi:MULTISPECIES: hypothetical protein [Bradyrhizobium]|jgi:hypothetical protein|nr:MULTISPECIES: hypothetical protein [Bradyrhizobium]MBM7488375.1 hypothetical protein [Bradyrhizobium canariense]UFW71080.1 hypothetical protein BcanWU425_30940 [Bradyrhizobium canariense]